MPTPGSLRSPTPPKLGAPRLAGGVRSARNGRGTFATAPSAISPTSAERQRPSPRHAVGADGWRAQRLLGAPRRRADGWRAARPLGHNCLRLEREPLLIEVVDPRRAFGSDEGAGASTSAQGNRLIHQAARRASPATWGYFLPSFRRAASTVNIHLIRSPEASRRCSHAFTSRSRVTRSGMRRSRH